MNIFELLVQEKPCIEESRDLENNFGVNTPFISFSRREAECAYYLVRGLTAKQIGHLMHVSPRTIETYIRNLKNKLHCRRKSDIIYKLMNNVILYKHIVKASGMA